jgi:anti-sigma-K factor RskA
MELRTFLDSSQDHDAPLAPEHSERELDRTVKTSEHGRASCRKARRRKRARNNARNRTHFWAGAGVIFARWDLQACATF